jgi:hypothetical protein
VRKDPPRRRGHLCRLALGPLGPAPFAPWRAPIEWRAISEKVGQFNLKTAPLKRPNYFFFAAFLAFLAAFFAFFAITSS